MTAEKRVRLRGALAQTATWATIGDDGSLVVELYDFSAEAHTWLGNDVAFLLHVSAGDKDRMLAQLQLQAQATRTPAGDALLLKLIEERFDDYYAVQQWLNDQGIPFRKEFEPWA